MRLTLPFLVAAIAAFFMPALAKAQPFTIQSHYDADSCKTSGGIKLFFKTQAGTGLTMTTYFGDGTSNTMAVSAVGAWNQTGRIYSLPGTYTVRHVLYHNGNPVDSITKSILTKACSYVPFTIFRDDNMNCIFDPGEGRPQSGLSKIEIDSAGVKIDTIDAYGGAFRKMTVGKSYTFRLLSSPVGTTAVCPSSGTITTTINPNTVINFGIQCAGTTFDLSVLHAGSRFRPVSTSAFSFMAKNLSCADKNATVTLNFSPKYSFDAALPAPASVSGNTVTWNVADLSVTETEHFRVWFKSATSIAAGDTVCTTVSITPTAGDLNLANNIFSRCDSVRASFDPNSKEAYPAPGPLLPNTRVEYTINFENLGNDTAFNIHILDTLSTLLDPASFEMLGSSHPASPTLYDGPNSRTIIKFDLADIMLADKSSPESNKGSVKYAIKTKPTWFLNEKLENRAGIYFDINPVVMTNTTVHYLKTQGVDDAVDDNHLKVYPNPANDRILIQTDPAKFNSVKLINSLGQIVASAEINDKETSIDVKGIPAGLYYISVSGAAGVAVEKIEKQ